MDEHSITEALARERELWDAYRAADEDELRRLIDPSALDVGPAGPAHLDAVIAAVRRMRIDFIDISKVHVRAFGSVQVITYCARIDGTYDDSPFDDVDIVASTVWQRQSDGWRVIHRHEVPARA